MFQGESVGWKWLPRTLVLPSVMDHIFQQLVQGGVSIQNPKLCVGVLLKGSANPMSQNYALTATCHASNQSRTTINCKPGKPLLLLTQYGSQSFSPLKL
jgi:hypothetical protein